MKRLLALFLILACLLCGCTKEPEKTYTKYTATFLTLFDTVTTIIGYSESKEAFTETANAVRDRLDVYHKLFDIYNDYEGLVNLKYVNDHAAQAPVKVGNEIFSLLTDMKEVYKVTGGKVNAAMGSVLTIWHEARTDGINDPVNAYLPDQTALKAAALHTDFDKVILDAEASTVYFSDPYIKLDVGAVAKGWAAQKASEASPEGLLISVGGNVLATGPRASDGSSWVVGIQNPYDPDAYLHTLNVKEGSVVTSGDYQRSYTVNGVSYHHIIDPATLYPASYWRSVTICVKDSGLADALSTALFLMNREDGQALLNKYGAEALWVDTAGNLFYSPGFKASIRT